MSIGFDTQMLEVFDLLESLVEAAESASRGKGLGVWNSEAMTDDAAHELGRLVEILEAADELGGDEIHFAAVVGMKMTGYRWCRSVQIVRDTLDGRSRSRLPRAPVFPNDPVCNLGEILLAISDEEYGR